jgi:hypothetical protein
MKRFKWHMLPLVRAILCGSETNKQLNSRQAEKLAQTIIDVMAQHRTAATEVFTKVVTICQSLGR